MASSAKSAAAFVAHDYDPRIVYHSHSSNLPHLANWIDELIRINEQSVAFHSSTLPTTELIIQAMQRYDVCFRELLRQTSIFSDDLTKLYSKVWIGNLRLLDSIIKTHHRYVRQSSKTQEMAEKLIKERQAQKASLKVSAEEAALERVALRAEIRNLEGEISVLKMTNRSLERDNKMLRETVEYYIEAKQPGLRALDAYDTSTKDDELMSLEETSIASAKLAREAQISEYMKASHEQFQSLCQMDTEMSELLSHVLKEEDLQRMVIEEFSDLLQRNADVIGASFNKDIRGEAIVKKKTKDVEIQVDDITHFPLVNETDPDEFSRLPSIPQRKAPPAASLVVKAPGSDLPYLIRREMKTFPFVLRIPPLSWTVKAIFHVYLNMIRSNEISSLQPTDRLTRKRVYLHTYMFELFNRQYAVPSAAEHHFTMLLKAAEFHLRYHKGVEIFAAQLGVLDKENHPEFDPLDTNFILKLIKRLCLAGEIDAEISFDRIRDALEQPSTAAVMAPLASHATATTAAALATTSSQGKGGPSVSANALNKQGSSRASMSVPALNSPQESRKASTFGQKSNPTGQSQPVTEPTVVEAPKKDIDWQMEVNRSVAIATTKALFEHWAADKGEDFAIKVVTMAGSKIDSSRISFHDYLAVSVEQWRGTRAIWEDHLDYLFKQNSSVYNLVQPLFFYNDLGSRGRECTLTMTQRAGVGEPKKRVIPFSDRFTAAAKNNDNPLVSGVAAKAQDNNANKDWVYELMSRRGFKAVLLLLKPKLTMEEIDEIIEDALHIQHEMDLKCLEKIWIRYPTKLGLQTLEEEKRNRKQNSSIGFDERGMFMPMHDNASDRGGSDDEDWFNDDDSTVASSVVSGSVAQRRGVGAKRAKHGPPEYYYYNTVTKTSQWRRPYYENTYQPVDVEFHAFLRAIMMRDIMETCPLLQFFHVTPRDLWANKEIFIRQIEQQARANERKALKAATAATATSMSYASASSHSFTYGGATNTTTTAPAVYSSLTGDGSVVGAQVPSSNTTAASGTARTQHLAGAAAHIGNGASSSGGDLGVSALASTSTRGALIVLVCLWYILASGSVISSKFISFQFPFPMHLCLVQLFTAVVTCTLSANILSHGTISWTHTIRINPMMAAAGVLFSLGFVFTNQAFLHGDVSFAETVKAGEPLSTVMLGLLLQAESASLPVYASLGVVCTGVAMSCYSTTNFSMPSFVFAALSNFCFSGRAVVLKKVQRTAAISTTVTQIILNFAQMCSSGLMVVVPLALVFETGEVLASFSSDGLTKLAVLLACNGLMFTTYNVLSMVVLARTQLFTHTLLNAIRRIWIIFTSVLYFGNSMSVVNVMGAGVAVAGGVLYSMLNKHYAKAQR